MLNKKGQALIEFIIILPIFLILVMGIFDFGNIMYQRYKLENSFDLYRRSSDIGGRHGRGGFDSFSAVQKNVQTL